MHRQGSAPALGRRYGPQWNCYWPLRNPVAPKSDVPGLCRPGSHLVGRRPGGSRHQVNHGVTGVGELHPHKRSTIGGANFIRAESATVAENDSRELRRSRYVLEYDLVLLPFVLDKRDVVSYERRCSHAWFSMAPGYLFYRVEDPIIRLSAKCNVESGEGRDEIDRDHPESFQKGSWNLGPEFGSRIHRPDLKDGA